MTVTLSQDAEALDLAWVEGDPLSLAFSVADVNWAGTYTAHVRKSPGTALLLALTVTATLNGDDTDFTLSASAADNDVPAGGYRWDLQQVGGVTRLSGAVKVRAQVTR